MTKHICIDFEGEGRKESGLPLPHLLGALVPRTGTTGRDFRIYLLRPELEPLARAASLPGKVDLRKACDLSEAISELVALAEERDCRLVSYSQHEEQIVHTHLASSSPARIGFDSRWYNVKRKAHALRKRRGLDAPDKTLESLLTALMPGRKSPPPPSCGAAESCRRLEKAGAKSKRWRNWSPAHKQLARELLDYNKGDCVAVWKLVNRVMANYRNTELGRPSRKK